MKSAKPHSLRTQQAIARFGKAAQYPICQAWLDIQRLDDKTLKTGREAKALRKDVDDAKETKRKAQWLVGRFYEERKEKEAIEAAAIVKKVSEYLPRFERGCEANRKLIEIAFNEFRPLLVARFERECDAPMHVDELGRALRALQRVKKRWEKPKPLSDGERRELETTKILHDKAIKGASATGGIIAGYAEAVFGGNIPLNDDHWSERLTAQELRSRLMAIGGDRLAGDKDAKEVRRLLKRWGVLPAEDDRGRKRKPPRLLKPKARRPVGRPRKVEICFAKETETVEGAKEKAKKGIPIKEPLNSFWCPSESDRRALEEAERELQRLRKRLHKKRE